MPTPACLFKIAVRDTHFVPRSKIVTCLRAFDGLLIGISSRHRPGSHKTVVLTGLNVSEYEKIVSQDRPNDSGGKLYSWQIMLAWMQT
jgi:hypothetical protein